ncbi:thiol-disulfide oxidoreductase DCC family protein [Demequina activiva]|uniref:Thiol-disulfide oxidoreductase n=1 Tax=Demequina activiva TaxID=1582364 RepID=A0A919Q332_9MICO|nr:DCC1-like thiol-disulfide oxidoreductase family protein [Demequina activiva]GIG55144.1 thiol-disulfide oxidoreductase [Demequina activiva]
MARSIVIFDGDCGLCNGFVAWLIRHDTDASFLIIGSAGEVGRSALSAMGLEPEVAASTLVVATVHGPRVRSDAVAEVLSGLGWPWRAGAIVRWAPRGLRDRVYDAVARRRPRSPSEDPACGNPPRELIATWRSRLASQGDIDALVDAQPSPRG